MAHIALPSARSLLLQTVHSRSERAAVSPLGQAGTETLLHPQSPDQPVPGTCWEYIFEGWVDGWTDGQVDGWTQACVDR